MGRWLDNEWGGGQAASDFFPTASSTSTSMSATSTLHCTVLQCMCLCLPLTSCLVSNVWVGKHITTLQLHCNHHHLPHHHHHEDCHSAVVISSYSSSFHPTPKFIVLFCARCGQAESTSILHLKLVIFPFQCSGELQVVTYKQATPRCVTPSETDAMAERVKQFCVPQIKNKTSCLKQWFQSGLSEGNFDGEEE